MELNKYKNDPGFFDVYDFSENHIIAFYNRLKSGKDKIFYLNYVLREITKNINNIDYVTGFSSSSEFSYTEYYNHISRQAILYGSYKNESENEDKEKMFLKFLLFEKKNLQLLEQSLKAELTFLESFSSSSDNLSANPDQDSMIEKFKQICINRKLKKGKTIPRKLLYEIGMELSLGMPAFNDFKSGEKYYQELREYASRLGFKNKRPSSQN